MTMLFMDGFEAGDWASKWDTVITNNSGLTASTRFSSGSAFTNTGNTGAGASILKKSFTPSAKVTVGVAYKSQSGNADTANLISLYGDGGVTQHLSIRYLTTGQVALARGATQIAVSAATGLTGTNIWAYYEIQATLNDTTGIAIVKVNGVEVINFVGDTKNAGTNSTIDALSVNQGGITSATPVVDDVYILNDLGSRNNDFLGDVRVQTLVPNGAGSSAQLTPVGSANNWDNVNELPISGTDYNYSSTAGHKDLYALTDVLAGSSGVFAVQANVVARKTDAGLRQVKALIKAGATQGAGALGTLGTASDVYHGVFETNPDTGLAWTVADMASLEAGVEVA